MHHFFAYMARMRFIDRWALMRNSYTENIQEHSHQVAILAHALAVLRQAQSSRSRLRLSLAGPDGAVQERQVRVMAVEPGRVRLRDVVRETELTVAVHRIVSVEAS